MEQANKQVNAHVAGVQQAMKEYKRQMEGVKEWKAMTARLCQTDKDQKDRLGALQLRVDESEKH